MIIVDEFTGRTMPGRRWGDGLHQAVEAKERLPIQNETVTLASISYQVRSRGSRVPVCSLLKSSPELCQPQHVRHSVVPVLNPDGNLGIENEAQTHHL